MGNGSLPSRECGLKWHILILIDIVFPSLPSRECGLKSFCPCTPMITGVVTPFAGVWIEIRGKHQKMRGIVSLPSRECGLKYVIALHERKFFIVTPFAGVWIEIAYLPYLLDSWHCHSLRGSVD